MPSTVLDTEEQTVSKTSIVPPQKCHKLWWLDHILI